MFKGEERAIATLEAIDLPHEAESLAGEFDANGLVLLISGERGMQLAPGIDAMIGDTDFLDFFEVEQTTAVEQGMKGHDAHLGNVRIEKGQREHEATPKGDWGDCALLFVAYTRHLLFEWLLNARFLWFEIPCYIASASGPDMIDPYGKGHAATLRSKEDAPLSSAQPLLDLVFDQTNFIYKVRTLTKRETAEAFDLITLLGIEGIAYTIL